MRPHPALAKTGTIRRRTGCAAPHVIASPGHLSPTRPDCDSTCFQCWDQVPSDETPLGCSASWSFRCPRVAHRDCVVDPRAHKTATASWACTEHWDEGDEHEIREAEARDPSFFGCLRCGAPQTDAPAEAEAEWARRHPWGANRGVNRRHPTKDIDGDEIPEFHPRCWDPEGNLHCIDHQCCWDCLIACSGGGRIYAEPPPGHRWWSYLAHGYQIQRTLFEWAWALTFWLALNPAGDEESDELNQQHLWLARRREKNYRKISVPKRLVTILLNRHSLARVDLSTAAVERLVLRYADTRWKEGVLAPTIGGECSALAGLSRRLGFPVPPYCGPSIVAFLEPLGLKDRPMASQTLPIPISTLLKHKPTRKKLKGSDWAWAALMLTSWFCLRTGMFPLLQGKLFLSLGEHKWLFLWRGKMKSSRARAKPIQKKFCFAAAQHPTITFIIQNLCTAGRPLGALTSDKEVSSWVRDHLPEAFGGFNIRAYGTRVAAAQDAAELQMPHPLRDSLFWWSSNDMGKYYSGTNIEYLFRFSQARAQISYSHILGGVYQASVPPHAVIDWSTPPAPSALPTPNPAEIEDLWQAAADAAQAADSSRGQRA